MLTVQSYLLIVIIDHSLLAKAELSWGPPAFLIAKLKIEGQQPTLNDKCAAKRWPNYVAVEAQALL